MADQQIVAGGVSAAPLAYTVPGRQEIILKSLFANFDGTAAAAAFSPTIRIIAPGGKVVGEYRTSDTIAAGGSANASFFPRTFAYSLTGTGSGNTAYEQFILNGMPTKGGYWPLDDTTQALMDDIGPNNRDGAYTNNPTLQQPPLISERKAVLFSGPGSTYGIVLGGTNLIGTGSWTVGCWIKTTQVVSYNSLSGVAQLVCTDDGNFRYFQFRFVPATGLLQAIAFDSGFSHNVSIQGATAINDGVRHLVGARYDATGDHLTLWVDGVQDGGPASLGFAPSVTMRNLLVATRETGVPHEDFYDGVMDEVFLYGSAVGDTFFSQLHALG